MSTSIAILNESTVVTDAEVQSWIPALQTQVTDHFCPAWGFGATLTFVPKSERPPPDAWQIAVLDNSDQAGALGYHDLTADNLPLAKVFAKSDLQFGNSVS